MRDLDTFSLGAEVPQLIHSLLDGFLVHLVEGTCSGVCGQPISSSSSSSSVAMRAISPHIPHILVVKTKDGQHCFRSDDGETAVGIWVPISDVLAVFAMHDAWEPWEVEE